MAITPHNTVPSNNDTFLSDLDTFLRAEDAQRFHELFGGEGIVISGGTHSTGAGLTGAPSALTAYAGGYRIVETSSITYTDAKTTWVIAHKDTSGLPATPGNFARVSGTHYLIDEDTGASQPALPEDSTWLMKVTTSGGNITAVVDLRRTAISASAVITAQGDLIIGSSAGVPTRLAIGSTGGILLVGSGTLSYLAIGTTGQLPRSNGTTLAYVDGITTKGDLWTYSTVPARLGVGSNNQLLIANSSETTGLQWVAGLTTRGDLLYRSVSGYARLAIGAAGLVLTSDGTDVSWGSIGFAGGGTGATSFTASQVVRVNAANTAMESAGVTIPTGGTGNIVTESNTQTLTNKTLTTPTISSTGFTNANHDHTAVNAGGQIPRNGHKTAVGGITGTFTAGGIVDVQMDAYGFFPMVHVSDPTIVRWEPHGTDGTSADFPRFRLRETSVSANPSYNVDWRYITN